MVRNPNAISIAGCALFCLFVAFPAAAVNLDGLDERTPAYSVKLYGLYERHAEELEQEGLERAARFLRDRAEKIENGEEVIPPHPRSYLPPNGADDRALASAYEETDALVFSEAAGVAPKKIAKIQIAYELWWFALYKEEGADADAQPRWNWALDDFVNWSNGPELEISNKYQGAAGLNAS